MKILHPVEYLFTVALTDLNSTSVGGNNFSITDTLAGSSNFIYGWLDLMNKKSKDYSYNVRTSIS